MQKIREKWDSSNPLGLNESLIVMKAYAPYHHLYAVSLCFCVLNNMPENVPNPVITMEQSEKRELTEQIVGIAASCLNSALEGAANEPLPSNRVFSPQNWIKAKTCLTHIRAAIRQYFNMLPTMPNGRELIQKYREGLKVKPDEFEARWTAD